MIARKTIQRNQQICIYYTKTIKKESGKTRPVVTGCTSNTRGLSNSVSDVLESVANSEPDPYEVISSEDMLARSKVFNKKMQKKVETWQGKRKEKIRCEICKIIEIPRNCQSCGARDCPDPAEMTEIEKERIEAEMTENIEEFWNNNCCGNEIKEKMSMNCENCGPGIHEDDRLVCLIGNDVIALFSFNNVKKYRNNS